MSGSLSRAPARPPSSRVHSARAVAASWLATVRQSYIDWLIRQLDSQESSALRLHRCAVHRGVRRHAAPSAASRCRRPGVRSSTSRTTCPAANGVADRPGRVGAGGRRMAGDTRQCAGADAADGMVGTALREHQRLRPGPGPRPRVDLDVSRRRRGGRAAVARRRRRSRGGSRLGDVPATAVHRGRQRRSRAPRLDVVGSRARWRQGGYARRRLTPRPSVIARRRHPRRPRVGARRSPRRRRGCWPAGRRRRAGPFGAGAGGAHQLPDLSQLLAGGHRGSRGRGAGALRRSLRGLYAGCATCSIQVSIYDRDETGDAAPGYRRRRGW